MYKIQEVIKNKFWIVNSVYGKVGTLRFREDNKYEFFQHDSNESMLYDSIDEIFVLEQNQVQQNKDLVMIDGLPTGYTSAEKVTGYDFSVFKKSKSSTTLHAAGYWVIKFTGSSGWQWALAPKLQTLDKYYSKGPYPTEWDAILQIKKERRIDDEKLDTNST